MNHFEVKDGVLFCEDVALTDLALEAGTPVYVYSAATLRRHAQVFLQAVRGEAALGPDPLVAFAVKALSNRSVLRVLAAEGLGADTVSEGEIRRALDAGVAPDKIIFSGVGKTDAELKFALDAGVYEINVESEVELARLSAVAAQNGVVAPVLLRVNPKIGAGAHAKITTGGATDKFGVPLDQALELYARAAADPHLAPKGVGCHIGSQITDLEPLKAAFAVIGGLVAEIRAAGLTVERLDLGGGLGAPYFNQPEPPAPAVFAAAVAASAGNLGVRYAFEPGRNIAANAGVLLTRVIHINARPDGRRFAVLDAGMNDLMRPALYDAYHHVAPVTPREGALQHVYDLVGPVCESTCIFARDRLLPELQAGDLLAFLSAGAYGAVMSNDYNTRPLVPETLVEGNRFAVVRSRPTYAEILAREPLAPWLS